jgi:hypothetical protein
MILPPRSLDHRRPDSPRRSIDLVGMIGAVPPRDDPHLDRFAVPPWDHQSPQWLAIDDDLPADHLARALDEAVDRLDLTALFRPMSASGPSPIAPT